MTTPTRRFSVALSFPGEHRPVVAQVADQLSAAVGREQVLYDKYYEAEFARMDLDVYLPRLYREQSELIVLFLCPEYAAKRWCQLEWRHIRQLIATVDAGRIMLLSFGTPGDLSDLGILPGDGYVDVTDRSASEIAGLILQRLNGSTVKTAPAKLRSPSPQLDIGRLPIPGEHFLGRDAELARLDAAWEDPSIHVLTLVAFGGVGKSALVARWMDRMAADGWRGATRVLDWSFYSQGSKDQHTSAEPFIDYALRFFGDSDPKAGSLHDRGARLANLIRKERSLLVLDGVEPLQYPPGRPEIEGRLKDPGLTALLKGLAAGNPGLCVVTTRERIADLAGFSTTAPQIPLEVLEPDAAVVLLRQLGVVGREGELNAAVEEFQRHALTLTLLGNFLRRAHGGDIRKRHEIDLHRADEKQGGHAFRVIDAYARWLGEGPELAILRLLGLFDRPAEAGALKALRASPPIPRLTDRLFKKKGWWKKEAFSQEDCRAQ
jgi:hypothetical protein